MKNLKTYDLGLYVRKDLSQYVSDVPKDYLPALSKHYAMEQLDHYRKAHGQDLELNAVILAFMPEIVKQRPKELILLNSVETTIFRLKKELRDLSLISLICYTAVDSRYIKFYEVVIQVFICETGFRVKMGKHVETGRAEN